VKFVEYSVLKEEAKRLRVEAPDLSFFQCLNIVSRFFGFNSFAHYRSIYPKEIL
jgi:hypothetical protein